MTGAAQALIIRILWAESYWRLHRISRMLWLDLGHLHIFITIQGVRIIKTD